MPDMKGFHSQEIPLPKEKTFHVEMLNGRPYKACKWQQWLVYPQMTGKMQIPSITFEGIVIQQNRDIDPFEAFFNGGSGYVEIKRDIVAPSLNIEVVPLPAKPVNFSGGVGRFNIAAQLLGRGSYKEGDPVTLRVVIGGNGNLKLVKQPGSFLKAFLSGAALTIAGIPMQLCFFYQMPISLSEPNNLIRSSSSEI